MDKHTDSRGEHRAVDDDAVPAVEAKVTLVVGQLAKRVPAGKRQKRLIPRGQSGVVIVSHSVKLPWYARLVNRMADIGRWMVRE